MADADMHLRDGYGFCSFRVDGVEKKLVITENKSFLGLGISLVVWPAFIKWFFYTESTRHEFLILAVFVLVLVGAMYWLGYRTHFYAERATRTFVYTKSLFGVPLKRILGSFEDIRYIELLIQSSSENVDRLLRLHHLDQRLPLADGGSRTSKQAAHVLAEFIGKKLIVTVNGKESAVSSDDV